MGIRGRKPSDLEPKIASKLISKIFYRKEKYRES